MKDSLKSETFTSSKTHIINLVEQGKDHDGMTNLNKTESLIKSNTNNNEIEMEEKDFIKIENKDNNKDKAPNINENKYSIKSNEKDTMEKTGENTDKSLNLKTLVKSRYILKKILLILEEKRRLLLLKYNKYYHNLMGINVYNYKKVSGKKKIDGIIGYGKEYGLDKYNLIFKGYYINGKRNGIGKEYDCDIIFKGEYINGVKNGKGIEYNEKGILFEGDYLNGKRWNWFVKEYHDSSHLKKLKFYGYFCNGEKIGREYDIDGQLIFKVKYLDDKRWNGTIYNNNGFLFPIKNGNGKIKEYNQEGKLIFKGEYINGEKNGKIYEQKYDKLIFEDEYRNEKKIEWKNKGI